MINFIFFCYEREDKNMRGEFKVYKSGDFTVMPIVHLKDKTLSLKAVGLLSKMLSLPDDWDYSLNGLVAITKDGLDSVRSALNELKDHDYVEILKLRTDKGTFKYNYLVFENPADKALKLQNKPDMENPYLDEPNVVNQGQYNIKEYNIKQVFAHNMRFDHGTLNNTERWLSKSKYRYFFPYGIEICDTLKMARDVIGKMPSYKRFCKENELMTKNNQCRFTAEALFRFISRNADFVESHTALEDVMIEKEILRYCYKQKKKMRIHCFS